MSCLPASHAVKINPRSKAPHTLIERRTAKDRLTREGTCGLLPELLALKIKGLHLKGVVQLVLVPSI